jgi:RNA polymerase sigma factor (sigma-70 family)
MSLIEDSRESIKKLAQGRLREGPMEAWKLFESAWRLLQRFVLHRFVHRGFPKYLMEDCGQIVMERVWKYRKTYKGSSEGAFWAWLRSICDNEQKRFLEKEARHPANLTEVQARSGADEGEAVHQFLSNSIDAGKGDTTVGTILDMETRRALKDCLSTLSEKQGRAIELMYGPPGLTERAVAELMGCSPSYVHKLKEQAIELLRRCLETKDVQ